jgi:hypothetical protein
MILIINSWRCGCMSRWALTTPHGQENSLQYQVEMALIKAEVANHRARCGEFAKLCGYVEYSEVGHGF